MTRGGTPRATRTIVLIFGENLNDSKSIARLLVAVNPELERRVKPVPRPISLTRSAKTPAVRDWVDELRRTVRGYQAAGNRVGAVLVHRDADGPDPGGSQETRLANQIATVPALPVVPVQMIEAWWFLFPDAVEAVRPHAWRGTLPRRPRDVEIINDPKGELVRLTGRRGRHAYTESDCVAIAEAIASLRPARVGVSASYDRFVSLASSLT